MRHFLLKFLESTWKSSIFFFLICEIYFILIIKKFDVLKSLQKNLLHLNLIEDM